MLGKIQALGAFIEDTGEQRVSIANFEKLANEAGNGINTFISTFTPDPAYLYLHVIAMGAGEYYGCNKNGDYFPEASLKAYHHTFEENAKVYKEHNNKSDSPSYGMVTKSWYNPRMHRVELLLAIDREKGRDIVNKVDNGAQIEVSMGCRVPHDVCSICGNKASRKPDYCYHITKELKQVFPDGKQVYMLNLQPTFFDISIVAHRADRIAYALKKVAGEIYGSLDHVYDIPEYSGLLGKQASTKNYLENMSKTALEKRIIAEKVRVLQDKFVDILPMLAKAEPDLPAPVLDRMALTTPIPDILHSFYKNAIPMKSKELARIGVAHFGLPLREYKTVLASIDQARSATYVEGSYSPDVEELLEPFIEKRSSFGEHVMQRFSRIVDENSYVKQGSLHKKANPLSTGDFLTTYADMQRNTAFGTTRRDAPYYDVAPRIPPELYRVVNYSTMPITYSPDEYSRSYGRRDNLRTPLDPVAVGLLLGGMLLAYKGKDLLKRIITNERPVEVAHDSIKDSIMNTIQRLRSGDIKQVLNKVTDNRTVTDVALPFIVSHLAASHYRDKYRQGQELNTIQRFVAEHPDYLSLVAPAAIAYGREKMHKTASHVPAYLTTNELTMLEKLSSFADDLASSAVVGLVFPGKGLTPLTSVGDQVLDTTLLSYGMRKALGNGSKSTPVPVQHTAPASIAPASTPAPVGNKAGILKNTVAKDLSTFKKQPLKNNLNS